MEPQRTTRGHSPTSRTKRALDRSRPGVLESIGADQIAYYRARAPWYDDVYDCAGDYDRGADLNQQWLADLQAVESALFDAPLHGECVELGSGTGYWSQRVIGRVERLWALDSAPETQRIARSRLGVDAAKVEFEVVDLWQWTPSHVWDAAVACFFLEHVPDEVLSDLLAALYGALRPGAPFFVAEAAAHDPEPEIETRSIDGRAFDVVERRRRPSEFTAAFAAAGFSVGDMSSGGLVSFTATRAEGK